MSPALNKDKEVKALIATAQNALQDSFGGVLKLAPDGAAPVWIDGRAKNPKVSASAPKNAQVDCVWRGGHDVLIRALGGERALENAYVSGGLQISGDMGLMARLTLASAR